MADLEALVSIFNAQPDWTPSDAAADAAGTNESYNEAVHGAGRAHVPVDTSLTLPAAGRVSTGYLQVENPEQEQEQQDCGGMLFIACPFLCCECRFRFEACRLL
jgi:hypothetical protein